MNKNAIQRFAIWARTELIAQVSQRAYQYDITAEGYGEYGAVSVGGRMLSDSEKKQRQQLINQIRSKGHTQVMEEVAYTWFNRFIALRFMEVNNYLPTHVRVFSDASGAFKPEILNDVLHLDLDGLDMEKVSDLIENNQTEDLYRYLLLTQCNALSSALPRMFEKMGSYTELLLPNNILRQDGILGHLVADIPEEDWTDQVQIIGWLYQYYNTELKDETFALLKKNVKITKERIPSATQLFTPDWIVRYMVENSLGRLWLEGHPDDELKAGWKYYLDEAEQEPDVRAQLEEIRAEYRTLRPQDIKVIDPCMGSGHILVYAFDVLIQIYKKAGFSERDAAQSILKNNLYGLDIDDRAAQLAYFAVMMKARQYDRRIFTRKVQPNVYAIVESNSINIPAMWRLGTEQKIAERLLAELKDGKEYGSILNLSLNMDELAALRKRLIEIDEMSCEGNLMDMMESDAIFERIFPLVEFAEVLVQQYHVMVTNPPYMAVSNASIKVQDYVKKNYPDSKADLFAVFIERCRMLVKRNGFQAMITQHSWMFLSSFEKLRAKLQSIDTINMAHLGARAFDEISGEVVQTTSFVVRNSHIPDYLGKYQRLIDGMNEAEKAAMFCNGTHSYTAKQSNFSKIPGSPVAYWVGKQTLYAFEQECIDDRFLALHGFLTGHDEGVAFDWFEIDYSDFSANCKSQNEMIENEVKFVPLSRGGDFRRWYGVGTLVVRFDQWAMNYLKPYPKFTLQNREYYFRCAISWPLITTKGLCVRYISDGYIFGNNGPSLFSKKNDFDDVLELLGFLNSKVGMYFEMIINPTVSCSAGVIKKIPLVQFDNWHNKQIISDTINLSKSDWDSFETSWDFQRHPMVRGVSTVKAAFEAWKSECDTRFQQLKANEEELNRIFIDIYGLQGELTPEVEDKDVTVRRADLGRDIRSLISYAVGCMFGRYSLYKDGLIFAGEPYSLESWVKKMNDQPGVISVAELKKSYLNEGIYINEMFFPDKDNIIPICDDEYFDDDIVGRFVKWVETVYGKDTLEENLKFIADALGENGSPRQAIRNYFLNDFYADHLKIYQKRPIYWLFDSGKKNGFKALIYMHRYQSDTLARLRTDYVHEQQERYRTQLKHIGDAMDSASASERVKLTKQQKKLQEQALELQKYEEKVHHLADMNIKIDLDDGVKHNYELFADVLAKIK